MQRRVFVLPALVNTRAVRYQNANRLCVTPFRNDMQGDLTIKPCGIDRGHFNAKKHVSAIHLGEYLLQRLHASNDEVERRGASLATNEADLIQIIDLLLGSPKTCPAIAPTDC